MATREDRERALIKEAVRLAGPRSLLAGTYGGVSFVDYVTQNVDRTHPIGTPPVDAGVRADPRDIEHHIAEEREARDEADALVARLVAVKDPGTWLRRVVAAGVLLADVMPDGIGELAIADEVLSRFGPPPSSETSERAAAIEECALVCDAGDCYLASDAAARIRALASPLPRVEAEPVPVDAHGWCSRCGGNGIEPGASEQMPDGEWRHERCTACDGSATGPCHPSATWSLLHPREGGAKS